MKFLFVIDNLNTGGAQRQIVNLAVGMAQRGHQVELFCYAPGDSLSKPLHEAGIPIHRYYKHSRYSPDVIFVLKNLIVAGRYNLVLSYLPTPNLYAVLACRILSLQRVPVIVSERRIDLPTGPSLTERMVRQSYRLATHVVTNSHHQRITLAKDYPHLKSRLSTIYNGLDLQLFAPMITKPDNHPIRILGIASVVPHKNVRCLVEALNILKQENEQCPRVDWIGRHILEGDLLKYSNQINHSIQEYGLEQQWVWLNPRSDIIDQLQQHDVFIHPAYIEGLPNVVCEALACGRPVIASDTLDHSRLVKNGMNGYLFNYKEPAHLAEKIRMFINLSISERQKMGQCSREIAELYLSRERLVDDYERLFLSIVKQ